MHDFSWALEELKNGKKLYRSGWNGQKMFIYLVEASNFKVSRQPLIDILGINETANYESHIDMFTVNETLVPWLASQTDLLSDDWDVVK